MVKHVVVVWVVLGVACSNSNDNNFGTAGVCGNGTLDPGANGTGEQCDDGNTDDGDGCTSDCRLEKCGDNVVNNAMNGVATEECDGGSNCSSTCTTLVAYQPHPLTAVWKFHTIGAPTDLLCPAGFTDAVLAAKPIDPVTLMPTTAPAQMATFTCDAQTGVTPALPGAMYAVTLEIKNTSTSYTITAPVNVDLRTAAGAFNTVIYTDGGFLTYKWNLVDHTNAPVSCDAAGAGSHGEVASTIAPTSTATSSLADLCAAAQHVITTPLPFAAYHVDVTLSANNPLTIIGSGSGDATLSVPNATMVVPITVPIDGL